MKLPHSYKSESINLSLDHGNKYVHKRLITARKTDTVNCKALNGFMRLVLNRLL